MRVFLPLRKLPASHRRSSSSSSSSICESLEEIERVVAAGEHEKEPSDHTEQASAEHHQGSLASTISPSEGPWSPGGEIDLGVSVDSIPVLERKRSSVPSKSGALKTTGLVPPESLSAGRKRPSLVPRKRPRISFSVTEENLERPLASDQKPAAKPSAEKMGLGPPNRSSPPLSWGPECGMSNPQLSLSPSTTTDSSDDDPVMTPSSRKMPARRRSNEADTALFARELKQQRGLEIREQEGDGNCLFRAVSLQVYGDSSMHGQVRKQCMDFMERDKEHFSQFVTGENFSTYIRRKRHEGVHGNNPEIQAISELFNRPIEVFSPENGSTPLNIFHAEYKTDDAPIRLSYHDGNHYNAVIDPLVPTAGLGLGLPGLQPGLADKLQLAKAVAESDATADEMELARALKESDDDELQRALKESQLATEHSRSNAALAQSDVDATYFELEQAALEHSLHMHVQQEHGKKKRASSPKQNGNDVILQAKLEKKFLSKNASASDSLLGTASTVASLPSFVPPLAASVASVASAASAVASDDDDDSPTPVRSVDEYPPVVQEMVMNGFELAKVVRAVELIGENFDDLLAFLMSRSAA